MADFQKFNQLLAGNDYVAIEYFSYAKYCTFVKVMHAQSGRLFVLSIARQYKLWIPDNVINHYVLTKEDTRSREFTSQQLNESYPMIQLSASSDDVVDDISDKLRTHYKQPILIHNASVSEPYSQLKRLKYCFKMLEYKLALHTDQHILFLNFENNIDVYKIENYPRTALHSFYVVVTLEQLYARLNVLHDVVHQIESEFYGILDLNQAKHNQYLHTTHVQYFIDNNDKLLGMKQQLHVTYREIGQLLLQLQQRESSLSERLEALRQRNSANVFREAEHAKQREELDTQYKQVHSTKLQVMDKLLKLDLKIKNVYLVLDQLGFNLSLAFNELRSELYKMLL